MDADSSNTSTGANPERIAQVIQLRRSGAPGTHAQGTRRARNRAARNRAAILAAFRDDHDGGDDAA